MAKKGKKTLKSFQLWFCGEIWNRRCKNKKILIVETFRKWWTTELPSMTGIWCFPSFYSWKIKLLYLFLHVKFQISPQNHNCNVRNGFFTVISHNNVRFSQPGPLGMASKFNIVIKVFKTCRRQISILNTKYYESPFEKLRVRKTFIVITKVSKIILMSWTMNTITYKAYLRNS